MNLFLEVDGKIIVGEGQPDPLRCPDCRRIFKSPKKDNPLRCPFCEYHGERKEFKGEFTELGKARVLIAL